MKWMKTVFKKPGLPCAFLLTAISIFNSQRAAGNDRMARANSAVPVIYPKTGTKQLAGEEFWVEIHVGNSDNPVEGLYGVSFILIYESRWLDLIQPVEAAVRVGDFLGNAADVQILSPQVEDDTLAAGITRTDTSASVSGFGMLLQVGFRSKKSTPNATEICFMLSDVAATDSAWTPVKLQPEPFCMVVERPYGIRPNPFTPNEDGYNDQVEFNLQELTESGGIIRIFDLWGRKVRQIEQGWIWDGTDDHGNALSPGTYLYLIESQGSVLTKGTLGLVR